MLGKYCKRRLTERHAALCDAARYAQALKVNVEGRQQQMTQFTEQFCMTASQPFCNVVQGKYGCLKGTEKAVVAEFFAKTQYSSAEELSYTLSEYGERLRALAEEARIQAEKTVYPKVGLLLGAMAGILFL